MLSKNSASSRAIPFSKMVESVQENPFIPIAWQKEHKGMQGTEYFTEQYEISNRVSNWKSASKEAIKHATFLNNLGVTKQLCNRLLEPFMWHTVLCTATEFSNFFELRCPQYNIENSIELKDKYFKSKKDLLKYLKDNNFNLAYENLINYTDIDWLKINKGQAEIHMMALAEAMWDCMNESTPRQLKAGEWHIPFVDKLDFNEVGKNIKWGSYDPNNPPPDSYQYERVEEEMVKISTAMSARTSYTVVGDEKEFSYEKQIELHDRMANQVPFHASPFEHCARVMSLEEYHLYRKGILNMDILNDTGLTAGWCRNFRGFIQYREILETKN
jgi:DNA-directed RNA polymerase subunit N (RpoN/RPB10)